MDLHVRIGLEDMLIRISTADWQKICVDYIVGGEDLVLRGVYKNMETDVIVRGHSSGVLSVRAPKPNEHLPRFQVYRIRDLKAEFLEGRGIK